MVIIKYNAEKSFELLFLRTVPSGCVLDYLFLLREDGMVVSLLTRDMIRMLKKGEENVLLDSGIISCILTNSLSGLTI